MALHRKVIVMFCLCFWRSCELVNCQDKVKIFGPGLKPELVVLPARYFFVVIEHFDQTTYSTEVNNNLVVEISGKSKHKNYCRIWVNKLDRKDGSFIIRYKIYETCYDMKISIYYKSKEIEPSPFIFKGPVYPDGCDCPQESFELWLKQYGCLDRNYFEKIHDQLKIFNEIDMNETIKKIKQKYHKPESVSFCHYAIKNNKLYRECYGKYVGFNMFADNILLSLARKVVLPNMELVINLGDWPLINRNTEALPVFSWCGSEDTLDIVMPTYDITESTLENMGRVTLDILSVQGSVDREWSMRESKAFWRGRDSREERLKLVDIARTHPDLFNVSLTNFFFFRDKEDQYGPKQPHISFFKFFDYKYQINLDGTVAAYRLPYLLAGGSLVLKQNSPYFEHFYKQLRPWKEYVPVKRDLSDLKDRILWAIDNDDEALNIAKNARDFVNDNLLPDHIICYHAILFSEWSKKIKSNVSIAENMIHVPQPELSCDCEIKSEFVHEEL